MWVPTWGPSRVDVGADVGFVFWCDKESDERPVWRASPEFDSHAPRIRLFASWRDGVSGPFSGQQSTIRP